RLKSRPGKWRSQRWRLAHGLIAKQIRSIGAVTIEEGEPPMEAVMYRFTNGQRETRYLTETMGHKESTTRTSIPLTTGMLSRQINSKRSDFLKWTLSTNSLSNY